MMKLLKRVTPTSSSSNRDSKSSLSTSMLPNNKSRADTSTTQILESSSIDTAEHFLMASMALASPSTSLGTGQMSPEGNKVESFFPSPRHQQLQFSPLLEESVPEDVVETEASDDDEESLVAFVQEPVAFLRHSSSFLRVADLEMMLDANEEMSISSSGSSGGNGSNANNNNNNMSDDDNPAAAASPRSQDNGLLLPNFHRVSVDPPPGMDADPLERWVALHDGTDNKKYAPIAPMAVNALANTGLNTVLNETMWTEDSKTSKLLKSISGQKCGAWQNCTFVNRPCCQAPASDQEDKYYHEVLVWSGKFKHKLYGNELPAVRAAAIIDVSAQDLLDLLVDSSRVKEYNAMSLGRTDLTVLQDDYHNHDDGDGGPFGGITKVMRSESRPPMLRKILQFTSILHARPLEHGSFLLVSRAVNHPKCSSDDGGSGGNHVLVSEILMGVNWIRPMGENKCLFVSVNHIRSPMVPMMIAKRIGLQAAINFIHDLRKCCCPSS